MLDTPIAQTVFAYVDVETTGLAPQRGDRVCEVAVVRCVGDTEVERFVSLVDPQRPISSGAAAVNGLSDAHLRGQPTFAAVAPPVLDLLQDAVFVAHNAPFDLSFLDAELGRLGYAPLSNPCIDTLDLARSRYRFHSHSLSSLAWRLGLADGGAHRALADALIVRRLLNRLMRDMGARTLADLEPSAAALPGGMDLPPYLAQALRERRRLRLEYQSKQGVTQRVVEPLRVYIAGQDLYLTAYCHLRHERRTFRLDRIVMMRLDDD